MIRNKTFFEVGTKNIYAKFYWYQVFIMTYFAVKFRLKLVIDHRLQKKRCGRIMTLLLMTKITVNDHLQVHLFKRFS